MTGMPEPSEDEQEEQEEQERERYRELLEELRTIIPGVQVLFAFLLTVPFSQRFVELDPLGLRIFSVSLVTVGLAAVVFLTPAAYHRIAPADDRRHRLRLGVRSTIAGMALLAASISAAVFVVIRLIFSEASSPLVWSWPATAVAVVASTTVGGGAVLLWFALPLLSRSRRR